MQRRKVARFSAVGALYIAEAQMKKLENLRVTLSFRALIREKTKLKFNRNTSFTSCMINCILLEYTCITQA